MKHKKLFWIVGALLALLSVGMSAAQYITAAVDAVAVGEVLSWQNVVMDRIVPDAMQLVTEVFTLIVMLWPTMTSLTERVTGSCADFAIATDGVKRVSADGAATQEKIVELENRMSEAREEAKAAKKQVSLLCEVVGILACGNDTLVKNGTARKVMEVLESEGKD